MNCSLTLSGLAISSIALLCMKEGWFVDAICCNTFKRNNVQNGMSLQSMNYNGRFLWGENH
jgi:hypothetical protein